VSAAVFHCARIRAEHPLAWHVEAAEHLSREVDMRRSLLSLALGALTMTAAPIAGGADVGCCTVECHASDGARSLGSSSKSDSTQAECESRSPDCETSWRPQACAESPEAGAGFGVVSGAAVRESDGNNAR
jgi:hypothetical protein